VNAVLPVKVINKEIKIGYVPRLRLDDRVCLGDAVVTNHNGKAYLRGFNIGTEDLKIRVPSVELEEIDILPAPAICPDEPSTLPPRNPNGAAQKIFAISNSRGNGVDKINPSRTHWVNLTRTLNLSKNILKGF